MGLLDSALGGAGLGFLVGGPIGGSIGLAAPYLNDAINPDPVQQAPFQPFPVTSPFGSLEFDPATRQTRLQLSPQQEQYQNMFLRTTAGGPYGLTPEQQAFAAQSQGLGLNALGLSGLYGGAAGGAGLGFLNAASATNPQAIAQQQFDKMQALLSPRRERERLGLESRLLRQGLLGSTAGGEQFRAMGEANRMQDLGIAEGALRQGLQTQQGLFGMGLEGLSQGLQQQLGGMTTGLGLLGAPVQQQQQALSNFMSLFGVQQQLGNQLLGVANLGMQAGQNQATINAANVAAQNDQQQNQADMISGLLGGGLSLLGK